MSETDSRFFHIDGPTTMYGDSGKCVDTFKVIFTSCDLEGVVTSFGDLMFTDHQDALQAGRRWINTGSTCRSA
jgi:hypothetical protein